MVVKYGGRGPGHVSRWPKAVFNGPSLQLSNSAIDEGASTGRSVGTASVVNHPSGSSGWSFAETGGTGTALFAINSSTGAITNTAALDYETATSYTYQVTASKSLQTDIVQTFTISITNVLEVTLNALALDDTTLSNGASATVNITGATSTSTITVQTGSLPTGMTLNSGARTITGTPTVDQTANFTLRETHADGSNSPRDTSLSITVSSAVAPTVHITIGAIEADSTYVGIGARTTEVLDPGTFNYRTRSPAGISTSTPYDQSVAPNGTNYLSVGESYANRLQVIEGINNLTVPHGANGTKITGVGATWGVGKSLHTGSITRANAAIAAYLAANPSAVPIFSIFVSGGTNDQASDTAAWETNIVAAVADFRANVFKNGVSGTPIGDDATVVFRGMSPEYLGAAGGPKNAIEQLMRKFMYSMPNARYVKQPEGNGVGDNVHPNNNGQNVDGLAAANAVYDTTPPVITFPSSFSIYSGQKLAREIVTDKVAYYYLSGADAAQFEIVPIDDLATAGNIASSRTHWYLRWASDGNAPAAGTYNVTINAKGNAPTAATPVACVVTVDAAYGTQTETIVPTHQFSIAGTWSQDARGRRITPSVTLGRGVNVIVFNQNSGSATTVNSVKASNGLVAVADANNVNSDKVWTYYIYSAQAETVTLIMDVPGFVSITMLGISCVGTQATPTASARLAVASRASPHTIPSITCPSGGIILGAGSIVGYSGPLAGQTNTYQVAPAFTGYRTTTGSLGGTGNTTTSFAADAAFAPA